MARIKIECFEEDLDFIEEALCSHCLDEYESRFTRECNCECRDCINKNIEFVIKGGKQ